MVDVVKQQDTDKSKPMASNFFMFYVAVRQTSFRTKYQKVELFTEKGYLRSTSALQNPNDDMSVRKVSKFY